jgi:uroporphyrinogen-III synthase
MRILITRPKESAVSLIKHLQSLGHQVTIDPLIHILPMDHESVTKSFPPSLEIVVTTSQQAIRCLADLTIQRDFLLWCVGVESAKVAKELGFMKIHEAGGSAEALVNRLPLSLHPPLDKPILHVSGDVIRFDLVKALQNKGIAAQRVIVYKTQEAKKLSEDTQTALKAGTLDAILFYSPRTAHVFQTLCLSAALESYCETITSVCFSEAIKAEIQLLPWKNIRIAKKTTTDDLLNAMMMAD